MTDHPDWRRFHLHSVTSQVENLLDGLPRALHHVPPEKRKLGHAGLHKPAINLADHVVDSAEPPAAVHRSNLGFKWGALLNDQLGDCGEAMAIHGDEAFHLDAGTPVPPYADDDAETFYEEVGGYVPGNPNTDNGTDNSVLVQKWQQVGIPCKANGQRYKIAGSVFVDPKDERLTKIGIWEFVAVFRALGLPTTAQTQNGRWSVVDPSLQGDSAVGSWGYHDIPYLSYDQNRIRTITWGEEWLVDWVFDKAYAAGGFAVVTTDQLNLQGVSPAGVNWSSLVAALKGLPSVPAS